ncbi:DUF2147 domain-containing protein [Lutimaribacter sp. EGI FJ00015]|uniref:DUF2147 domain-containing protein n=1 Tax=Lutimaribacter degradans TaxID=2945989 RepID=A0ACC5ZS31_9RHOB|nr:DUF2147 domain-containing protein [Lutimaribacter sp. EGI FJ00013]MCM2560660.1 DUF2147 domain-containing protein [Lutimaribacter sp. EGI FJ00013]MCO0612397.1 DUF2147 domain-containing protein [Lutimaribacter sp. EGI FJ00015]MCO0634484.1 DUF2147 domain-containing protein [Lutimaribacter sp. EGI FJ00014]
MKKWIIAAAVVLAGAGGAMADPIEGLWRTQEDDGAYAHVEIAPCGPAYCGTIVRTFNADGEYQSPNIGKQLVRNMTPAGNSRYEGRVWRPSNDKVYIGKIDLNGNSLKMAGCVAGGLICAKQDWTRVR